MKGKQNKFIKPRKFNNSLDEKKKDSNVASNKKPFGRKKEDIFDNDIDEFYAEKEKIMFNDSDEDDIAGSRHFHNDNEDSEQEVMALDDSDSDSLIDASDKENVHKVLEKVPGLRRHLKKSDARLLKEAALSQEAGDSSWGVSKNAYYDDDADYDDGAIGDEVEEVRQLRRKALSGMDESDFVVEDSFGEALQKKKSEKNVKKTGEEQVSSADSSMEKQSNEDGGDFDVSAERLEALKKLPKKEIEKQLYQDSPELKLLLQEFKQKVSEIRDHLTPFMNKLGLGSTASDTDSTLQTDNGLSILDLKNQLSINYLMNVCFYMYLKADGRSVKDHPVIKKLIELRLYSEKLRAIEGKLKHHIEKTLSFANGDVDENSALNHQPRPDAFVIETGDYDNEEDGDEDGGVYRPPRIAPVHYDDEPGAGKKKREAERQRISATTSRMLKDAVYDLGIDDAPEEVTNAGDMLRRDDEDNIGDRKWRERLQAEEEMMTRLPVTKQEKSHMKKKAKLTNELENLDDFGDVSAFIEKMGGDSVSKKSSKRQEPQQQESDDNNNDDDDDMSDIEEDDIYEKIHRSNKKRKDAKRKRKDTDDIDNEDEEEEQNYEAEEQDGKRGINFQILKNKGMLPKRTKEQRNPRVKRRKQYEKSLIKLKSFKPMVKSNPGAYHGEDTGIKKNLARSVKFQ